MNEVLESASLSEREVLFSSEEGGAEGGGKRGAGNVVLTSEYASAMVISSSLTNRLLVSS